MTDGVIRSYLLAQVAPAVHPGLEDGRMRRKSHSQPGVSVDGPTGRQTGSVIQGCLRKPEREVVNSPAVVDGCDVSGQDERVGEDADGDLMRRRGEE